MILFRTQTGFLCMSSLFSAAWLGWSWSSFGTIATPRRCPKETGPGASEDCRKKTPLDKSSTRSNWRFAWGMSSPHGPTVIYSPVSSHQKSGQTLSHVFRCRGAPLPVAAREDER